MQGTSGFLLVGIMFSVIIFSCKKNTIEKRPSAILMVATAVIGGGNVKLNDNEKDSAKAYNGKAFAVRPGMSNIKLFATNNTAKPYFNTTQETTEGGIYSVFLSGTGADAAGLFVKESIPLRYLDSAVGVRVINLSPNSNSLNITLASETVTNLFYQLEYRKLFQYVKVPAKTTIPSGSLTFQVRDGVTNALLATYALPTSVNATYPNISITLSRFRNITLVIKGLQGTTTGPDAFGIFPVANY